LHPVHHRAGAQGHDFSQNFLTDVKRWGVLDAVVRESGTMSPAYVYEDKGKLLYQ
jgi:hypothetical protein